MVQILLCLVASSIALLAVDGEHIEGIVYEAVNTPGFVEPDSIEVPYAEGVVGAQYGLCLDGVQEDSVLQLCLSSGLYLGRDAEEE